MMHFNQCMMLGENMKKRQIVTLSVMLATVLSLFIGMGITGEAATKKFKTVGYLPDYDIAQVEHNVDLSQFTDLNFFSMVPKPDGELEFADSGGTAEMLKDFVKKAHKEQIRVGVSIGGWGLSDNFASATSDENRSKFISSLVKLTETYELDTIDIDWEYPQEDEAAQFETFMKELTTALKPMDVKVSICVPTGIASNRQPTDTWQNYFTPEALNYADWVNIMSYDAQVEGYPDHSPVELQLDTLNYWNKLMGGDKMDHLIAGVPYYAKSEQGQVITYNKAVELLEEKVTSNTVNYRGEEFYFNNQEIIKKKTEDAINAGSLGVMVWTPTQDADLKSDNRLTDTILSTIDQSKEVELDKARILFGNVTLTEAKKFPFKVLFNLLALVLLVLGMLFYRGILESIIPNELRGKKLNKEKFGELLGIIIGILAIICLIVINLPWYIILLIVIALAGGAYYLIKL